MSTRQSALSPGFRAAGTNNFDALRLLLAALVLVSHSFPLGVGSEDGEPLHRVAQRPLFGHPTTLGALAVDGFFILSGFLIAMSFERRGSTLDFLGRRVRRIYPGFVVAALFTTYLIPLVATNVGEWTTVGPVRFVANTLRLLVIQQPNAFATNAYPGVTNGALWSIPFEFWCYLGVATLGLTGLLSRRWAVTALFAASLVVAVAMTASGWKMGGGKLGMIVGYPVLWARLLPFYLAGVVVYRWRESIRFGHVGVVIAIGATVATARVPHAWAAVLPITLTYVLFWLGYAPELPRLNVTRFGDWSYGCYLYGFPIQQLCVRIAGGAMSPLALTAVSLPLSLLAGGASWILVERWFVRRPAKKTIAVVHDIDSMAVPSFSQSAPI